MILGPFSVITKGIPVVIPDFSRDNFSAVRSLFAVDVDGHWIWNGAIWNEPSRKKRNVPVVFLSYERFSPFPAAVAIWRMFNEPVLGSDIEACKHAFCVCPEHCNLIPLSQPPDFIPLQPVKARG